VNILKQQILKELKKKLNEFVSGEELSNKLNVSRTAIWKNIKSLQAEGYEIDSSTKKGYSLLSVGDILNKYEIAEGLKTSNIGKDIIYLATVDSTNDYAKKIAAENEKEGAVIIAGDQTKGRGRLGRHWSSGEHKGVWMSVILKPDIPSERIQIITLAAAVAVVKTIKNLYGIETGIKWPNDIILDGKKVCGILTEMNCEADRINYIVVGIGLNVCMEKADFPKGYREKATSLLIYSNKNKDKHKLMQKFARSEIIKRILVELEDAYIKLNKNEIAGIIKEWKNFSVTLGREVKVISRNSEFSCIAKDISEDGKLVVECPNGSVKYISSGEVSVRNLMGYN
jgi:BirA family biotin operon repressor/biotin-[acetyl-CoA-carboxylase] ligase